MLTRDNMVSWTPPLEKSRTIVMLTSSRSCIPLHFTETVPKNPIFPSFFRVFFHFSYAVKIVFPYFRECIYGTRFVLFMKTEKEDFFLQHYFPKNQNGHTFHVLS